MVSRSYSLKILWFTLENWWFKLSSESKFFSLSFLNDHSPLTVIDLFRTNFICTVHFHCSITSHWNPVWKFASHNYSFNKKEDILFSRCTMVDWVFLTFPQSFLIPREKPKALHEYFSTHFIFLSKLYPLSKDMNWWYSCDDTNTICCWIKNYLHIQLLSECFEPEEKKKRETKQRKLQLQRTMSIYLYFWC